MPLRSASHACSVVSGRSVQQPVRALQPPVRDRLLAAKRRGIPGEPDGHPRRAQADRRARDRCDTRVRATSNTTSARSSHQAASPRPSSASGLSSVCSAASNAREPPASRHARAPPGRHPVRRVIWRSAWCAHCGRGGCPAFSRSRSLGSPKHKTLWARAGNRPGLGAHSFPRAPAELAEFALELRLSWRSCLANLHADETSRPAEQVPPSRSLVAPTTFPPGCGPRRCRSTRTQPSPTPRGSRDSLTNGALIGAVVGAAVLGGFRLFLCHALDDTGDPACFPQVLGNRRSGRRNRRRRGDGGRRAPGPAGGAGRARAHRTLSAGLPKRDPDLR